MGKYSSSQGQKQERKSVFYQLSILHYFALPQLLHPFTHVCERGAVIPGILLSQVVKVAHRAILRGTKRHLKSEVEPHAKRQANGSKAPTRSWLRPLFVTFSAAVAGQTSRQETAKIKFQRHPAVTVVSVLRRFIALVHRGPHPRDHPRWL